jgi:hypothetical protein
MNPPSAAHSDLSPGTDMASAQADEVEASPASAATRRNRRIWVLALGTTAAIWQLDPALSEMAEMITVIACASNKSLARDAIMKMRGMAGDLRSQIAPLPASALSKVIRRTEAACGAVLDKGVRMKEVQASWDQFVSCIQAWQEPTRR